MQWQPDCASLVSVSGNDGHRREEGALRSFLASKKQDNTWNWAG